MLLVVVQPSVAAARPICSAYAYAYAYDATPSYSTVTSGTDVAFVVVDPHSVRHTDASPGEVWPAPSVLVAAETGEKAVLDATPGGRQYTAHYLNDTGPGRNIPGSVVDETIDHGSIAKDLPDRTVFYDPKNGITVVQSKTTGKIMSVRRGDVP